MRQFDVFANPFPRSRERQPFLVSLQSDLLVRSLDTTVVAPLEQADTQPFADRLNPQMTLSGAQYALIAQELVTVRKSVLINRAGSVAEHRDAIIRALDVLGKYGLGTTSAEVDTEGRDRQTALEDYLKALAARRLREGT